MGWLLAHQSSLHAAATTRASNSPSSIKASPSSGWVCVVEEEILKHPINCLIFRHFLSLSYNARFSRSMTCMRHAAEWDRGPLWTSFAEEAVCVQCKRNPLLGDCGVCIGAGHEADPATGGIPGMCSGETWMRAGMHGSGGGSGGKTTCVR